MKEGQTKPKAKPRDPPETLCCSLTYSLCTHSTSRDGWKRRKTRNMNVIRIYPFFYFLGGWVDYVIDGNQSFSIPDTLCVSRALHFFLSFLYTIIIFE
jgi:hypothetical protein